jgi:hypothetical protein
MKVSTTTLLMAWFGALILGGCASPAPAATHASPLDAGGLTGERVSAVQRIDVDTRRLAATLAWRELAARADADDTVSLPDLMRWFSQRSGQTILVDPSAAHERVWLGSRVFCSISFDDEAIVR